MAFTLIVVPGNQPASAALQALDATLDEGDTLLGEVLGDGLAEAPAIADRFAGRPQRAGELVA